jgi:hypothetical protein
MKKLFKNSRTVLQFFKKAKALVDFVISGFFFAEDVLRVDQIFAIGEEQ